jgi:hypothetical protein
MARDASVTFDWADGTYTFRLAWGDLARLQEATDAGPYVLFQRLNDGTWKLGDISAVIRCGLIGGGMKPEDALKKIRGYVEDRPPMENLLVAQAILSSGLVGAPEEKFGKAGKGKDDERLDNLPNGKIRFSKLYGSGAVMGYTPQDINKMSVFEFMSASLGYEKAHGNDNALSQEDADDLWEWMQKKA